MGASQSKPPEEPAPTGDDTLPRTRDREATEARLLSAAGDLLAELGFAALGVNAVAKRAGVDKQLIYRYFGGLDGLIERLGGQTDLWLGLPDPATVTPGPYAAVIATMLKGYLSALRRNLPVRRILAWELVEETPALRRLSAVRSQSVGRWFMGLRSRITQPPPSGIDAPAINAILLAAAHHLALREQTAGEFTAIDLSDPQNWVRIEAAMNLIIERTLGTGPD